MIRNCWLGTNNKQFVPHFFARQYVQILHNLCRIKFCTFLEIRPPRNWDNFLDSLSCCASRYWRAAPRSSCYATTFGGTQPRQAADRRHGLRHSARTRADAAAQRRTPWGGSSQEGASSITFHLRHLRRHSLRHCLRHGSVILCGTLHSYAQSPPALKKFWGLCCTMFV